MKELHSMTKRGCRLLEHGGDTRQPAVSASRPCARPRTSDEDRCINVAELICRILLGGPKKGMGQMRTVYGVSKIKENNLPTSIQSHDNAPENLLRGHICHCTLSTKEQMTAVTNNHRGFSNHSIRRNGIVMTKEWF
ncbi:hypothetical protein O988_03005 [Pseudogymnoascus sp. VKM F-3808]|nr:hypothetical protein O988_03005 [Pseudogymnoascus sp. VKM F-3808]